MLLAVGYMVLKKEVFRLLNMLKDPVLVAFTTSSSEAAYPKTLERLVEFGCSRNIASFVLPIGYSFNLVGSMVYCSFAAMFIAQAYNIQLSFSEITVMMLTLMLASKGIAGGTAFGAGGAGGDHPELQYSGGGYFAADGD
ncbi:C4-dicarboxylate transport protein [Klebsiella michiganensis]|nr:C4-dicarboxylate transport protein [Klebsiella michiganensis]